MVLKEFQNTLNPIFQKHDISIAFIFGSYAKGQARNDSDIDIGVVFEKKYSPAVFFQKEIALSANISEILHIDTVDLINLKTVVSPVLKHNVVFEGKLLFAKDEKKLFQLQKEVLQEFEDTKHLRQVQYEYLKKHIKEGTFGNKILKTPYVTA